MRDVHEVIEALRELSGQPGFALDPDGHAELVFGGRHVGFVASDAHQLELVTPLRALGSPPDGETLRLLMTANYLGTATGPARLALDPGRDEVTLGQRIDARGLDAEELSRRLRTFLATASFWDGPDGHDALFGSPDTPAVGLPSYEEMLIRG